MQSTVAAVYRSSNLPEQQSTVAAHRDCPPGRIRSINYDWSFIGIWLRQADIDIVDEKKTGRDINYPVINYFDVVLDKKYLCRDIFYPKQH
jgi:hypothetical protein